MLFEPARQGDERVVEAGVLLEVSQLRRNGVRRSLTWRPDDEGSRRATTSGDHPMAVHRRRHERLAERDPHDLVAVAHFLHLDRKTGLLLPDATHDPASQ